MGNIVGTLNQENRNYDDNNFVHGNFTPAQLTGKGSTKTRKLELGLPRSLGIAVGGGGSVFHSLAKKSHFYQLVG